MEERGSQTQAPRAALPQDPGPTSILVWIAAAVLAAIFALGQIATVLAAAPAAIAYYAGAGAELTGFVAFVDSIGPVLFGMLLVVVDAVIFALCAWLGRKTWIGFAFLPPVLYLGLGSVALWLLLAGVFNDAVIGA